MLWSHQSIRQRKIALRPTRRVADCGKCNIAQLATAKLCRKPTKTYCVCLV